MNRSILLSSVSIILIIGLVLLSNAPSAEENSAEDIFQYPSGDIEETNEAIICLYGEQCEREVIEKKPVECDPYHPWAGESTECNYTEEDLENIALVTDENNYIKGKFSDREIKTEIINHNYSGSNNRIYYTDLEFLENGSYLMVTSESYLTLYNEDHENLTSDRLGDYIDNEEIMEDSSVIIKGIALDQDFRENNQIYVYYYLRRNSAGNSWSATSNAENYDLRVSRFNYNPKSENVFSDEKQFLNIDGPRSHMGGEVEIGPDNKLYITVGDGTEGERAQNMSNYRGKVLRLNTDGTIPETNPFDESFIYSLGHRNPQSLSWNPDTDNLFVSEHGPERYDEINRIESGRNYGWPGYKCDEVRDESRIIQGMINPQKCYKEWSMGPSGGVFVDDSDHPWYGDLFLIGLRGNHVRSYEVENNELGEERIFYYSKNPENNLTRRFRDIEYFNNSLYVVGAHQGLAELSPVEN